MPDTLTKQEKINQLTNAERIAHELRKELGADAPPVTPVAGNLQTPPSQRDQDVAFFNQATQSELKKLSVEQPDVFARVMESVRTVGELNCYHQGGAQAPWRAGK